MARTLLGQQDLCKSQALQMEFTNQIVYTELCIFELWDKFAFLTPLRLPNKLSNWTHCKAMSNVPLMRAAAYYPKRLLPYNRLHLV